MPARHIMCNSNCLSALDIGLGLDDSIIAYPDPRCPVHGDDGTLQDDRTVAADAPCAGDEGYYEKLAMLRP